MEEQTTIREILLSVAALLLGAALLLTGAGLLFTLVPLRASLENFSTDQVGLLGAAYFLGFALGCLGVPLLIRKVGHIRVFCGLTAVAVVAVLTQEMLPSVTVWLILRLATGASFAGLFLVMESWLNDAAPLNLRGQVFSIYAVISFLATIAGQMLLQVASPSGMELFAIVAILMTLAIIPISLAATFAPAPIEHSKPELILILQTAPAAAYGCFSVGLANGAFWALAPMLCEQAGLGVKEIAWFISLVVAGGALLQWPLGYFSDRVDRRIIIASAALVASAAGSMFSLIDVNWHLAFYFCGMLFGGAAFSIYALCVAHGSERVDRDKLVPLGSTLLLLFSGGAAVGPIIASLIPGPTTIYTLFQFTAVVHAVLGIAVSLFIRRKDAVPIRDRETFLAAPDMVPTSVDQVLGVATTQEEG